MKLVTVEFKYRLMGHILPTKVKKDVEVESDSNDLELHQQINAYYYRDIINPIDSQVSEVFPYTLIIEE